ncbi:unnamed protein product [Didymodactylos carnosus]|uniref:Uncharacterized protein n=1 Tax=Didymodactylos carnosus TaxID=1234261 RepID=A0A8S2FAB2_9BILA|nr:unnamed protein product [Didymodactylos carnosus]CAF4206897.1 unnamed protein product [Didymodactylos carnosus]
MQATRQVTNIAWDIDDEELNFSEKLLVTDVGDLADLSFYELSENEWKQAVRKYQSLSFDGDVNYRDRTATASINIGTDAYFDNDTILGQFERLFQMREFKQEYKDNQTNKGTSTFVQQTTRPRHRSSLSIPSITSVEGQPSTTNRVFGTSPLF